MCSDAVAPPIESHGLFRVEGGAPWVARLERRSVGKPRGRTPRAFLRLAVVALLGASWWLVEGSGSPLNQAVAGLVPNGGEDGVLFFISLFGPRAYEAYLGKVVVPMIFLVLLLAVLLAKLVAVLNGLVRVPDEVLFFESHIEWVVGGDRLVLHAHVQAGGSAFDTSTAKRSCAVNYWWQRCRRRWLFRRLFLHPGGGLAIIPLREPGWWLRGADGRPALEWEQIFAECNEVCALSDRGKIRRAKGKRQGLFVGAAVVLLGLLVAVGAAGPYPWTPLLWALGRTDDLGFHERAELAAGSRYLQTLYYYLATIAAEDDAAASLGGYREVLSRYFASGGENYLMRAEAAVDHLGAGTPELGLSLLTPPVSPKELEFRLALAAGGGARAREVLRRAEKSNGSSGSLAALLEVLEGRPGAATLRLGQRAPETAQGAILRAVVCSILGDTVQARLLVKSQLVDDWRRGREAVKEPPRTQTIFFAYHEIRTVVSRAYAAAILDQPETADALWRWAEELALETGLPHSLDLDRRLWKRLEARFSS